MYGAEFCRVYNTFGWNVYPEAFAEQLLRWMEARGVRAASVLDLGCGTGALCEALRAAGLRASGLDLSRDMIRVARERCPEIPYTVGSMTDFAVPAPVDLITCTGDALNHLPALTDIADTFRCAFRALTPGGYMVFDLLADWEVEDGTAFEAEDDAGDLIRFRTDREPDGHVCLTILIERDGEAVSREEIRERLYDPSAVETLLAEAGFRDITRGRKLEGGGAADGTTWLITARKPEKETT